MWRASSAHPQHRHGARSPRGGAPILLPFQSQFYKVEIDDDGGTDPQEWRGARWPLGSSRSPPAMAQWLISCCLSVCPRQSWLVSSWGMPLSLAVSGRWSRGEGWCRQGSQRPSKGRRVQGPLYLLLPGGTGTQGSGQEVRLEFCQCVNSEGAVIN